jgi:hypothetical protein
MNRYNTYNPFQGGGMQIPQIQPQSQGMPDNNIQQLFEAFFRANNLSEDQAFQFMEEFENMQPQEQEQIISYIQEQLSGGQQQMINESQTAVQPETLAPEQEAMETEQAQMAEQSMGMMQTGGYGNGFMRNNSGFNPMQLQMSPLGVLPMQYDQQDTRDMHEMGGRNSYGNGGFYRYQTAGITPMVQPMVDNSDAYQFDEYTQNPSIPISQSQVPESFSQQMILPAYNHGEGSVLPSGDKYYHTAKASDVNKASAKRVVDLTDKDKQTLVDAGSKVKAMQRAIEEATGMRTGKLAGKYDGITGTKTIDGLRKLAASQGITKDKDIRDFALTNFGVEVPTGYLTGMAIKHNYDGAVKDSKGTKEKENKYSNFLDFLDRKAESKGLITPTGSKVSMVNDDKSFVDKMKFFSYSLPGNSTFLEPKNYIANKKELDTLNLSSRPNASNNWKATDSNKKLKEIGNGVYYHPDLKKILVRSPTGTYAAASENIIKQVLSSEKNRNIVTKNETGGLVKNPSKVDAPNYAINYAKTLMDNTKLNIPKEVVKETKIVAPKRMEEQMSTIQKNTDKPKMLPSGVKINTTAKQLSRYEGGGMMAPKIDKDRSIDLPISSSSGKTKEGHTVIGKDNNGNTFVYDPQTQRLLSTDKYNGGYSEIYDYNTQVKVRAIMEKKKIKSPVVTKKGIPV